MLLYILCLVKQKIVGQSNPKIALSHPRLIFEWAFAQSNKLSFL